MDERAAPGGEGAVPHETTAVLIARARAGDTPAGQRLFARLLPVLRRWAHHRYPARLRDARDTEDLVQDVLLRAFRRIDSFENREITLPPGVRSDAHAHSGPGLVYVLQGNIEAIGAAEPRSYSAGETLLDPAAGTGLTFRNVSNSDTARLLLYQVGAVANPPRSQRP